MILKHKAKEVYYLNKNFEDIDANFVKIESLYRKCRSLFSSKSQLHKHLKKDYIGLIQALLPILSAPVLPISIIKSKAIVPAIGSGFVF